MSDTPVLFMTESCHLCEDAQRVVLEVLGRPARTVDIVDDDALMARYGVRIPVVLEPLSGEELGWPFDAEVFAQWWRRSRDE